MSEMVERMARAAYEKWIEGVESLEPTWAETPQDFRDRLMDSQRAAIRAIREPTEAMLRVGPPEPYMDRGVWAAMIDEAMR